MGDLVSAAILIRGDAVALTVAGLFAAVPHDAAVITDPPYGIGWRVNGRARVKERVRGDELADRHRRHGVRAWGGPCLIPVGPGLLAPSGVLMIGVALVLRDALHELAGARAVAVAIAVGTALSGAVAPAALAVASAAAFLLGEAADFAVYAPLRRRRLWLAVALSGMAGAVVDSVVFLWVAFGALDYAPGNAVGKVWVTIVAAVAVALWRARHPCRVA